MAELQHTDVLDKFDLHLLTDGDSKEYCLKWTMKNFSRLPLNDELESVPFCPIPGCDCRLYFKKEKSQLFLYLENKFKKKITAKVGITIYDSKRKCWHCCNGTYSLNPNAREDILDDVEKIYEELHSLKDDILIILCNFKITGIFTTKCSVFDFIPKKYDGRMKLCTDLKTLWNDKRHADVTLKLNGGCEMLANKAFLSARSPVFDRMFRHNLDEQETSTVQIDDVTFEAFKKLVDFLYTGELDAESEYDSAAHLYYAADKYEVLDLRKMCADTLLSLVTVENVTEIIVMSDRHGDEYLRDCAMTFLSDNISCIVDTGTWKEFVSSETALAAQAITYCAKSIASTQSESSHKK